MVKDHAINFVSQKQIEKIINREKVAFVRMESGLEWEAYEDWKNGKEVYLILGHGEQIKGWVIVSYIDYFKWNELKTQYKLIQKCAFKDKTDMKAFLDKLYGIELFGAHLDKKPYLFYIEFEYVIYPNSDT